MCVDAETLERLLDAHSAALTLYVRQWCDTPEDIVQDVFLLLMRERSVPQNVVGWLFAAARNKAINAAQSARRRTKRETQAARQSESWLVSRDADRLDAAAAAQALAELPLDQREAIVARQSWGLLLAAKAHREIADGKYDDAVHTFQTGFALARDLGQRHMIISAALGNVIAMLMADQAEQFIQQPDAPNLYWSLVILPEPLVDDHTSFEAEMNHLYFGMPYLRDLDKKNLSNQQWGDLLARLLADCSKYHIDVPAARITEGYPRAKKYLIDHGRKPAEVEAMPRSQAVLLFTVGLYEELSDVQYKAWFLHYGDAAAEWQRQEEKLREGFRQEIIPLAAHGQVSLVDIKRIQTRMPFATARLRIFEALRIYAAAHDGKLPRQLADIREVPIPLNPYDDKPFTYRCDGNRAVLSVASGPGVGPWRCEITMISDSKPAVTH